MLDLTPVKPALDKLQAVERDLQLALVERDDPAHAAVLSLLTRDHLALLGMPGTAKSMLINELARRVSTNGDGLSTFVYLLTKFTTPEELFGPISIEGLKRGEYRRITKGKVPECELVFLDETFKASSAILNALLRGMNERLFENGPGTIKMPLISLFGASNEMPEGKDLDAMWDRFLIRLNVEYVSDSNFTKLLQMVAAAAAALPPRTITKAELETLQAVVPQVEVPSSTIAMVEQLRRELKAKGVIISDRRWGWSVNALKGQALLDGRAAVNEDDLAVLKHTLWTQPEQITEIGKIVARLGNPLNARAVELGDMASDIYHNAMSAQANGGSDTDKMNAAIEAVAKLKRVKTDLTNLLEQARAQGRATGKIENVLAGLTEQHTEIAKLVL